MKAYVVYAVDYGSGSQFVSIFYKKEDLDLFVSNCSKYEEFWSHNWSKDEWSFLPYPEYRHKQFEIEEIDI
jgi:hypothetical protein